MLKCFLFWDVQFWLVIWCYTKGLRHHYWQLRLTCDSVGWVYHVTLIQWPPSPPLDNNCKWRHQHKMASAYIKVMLASEGGSGEASCKCTLVVVIWCKNYHRKSLVENRFYFATTSNSPSSDNKDLWSLMILFFCVCVSNPRQYIWIFRLMEEIYPSAISQTPLLTLFFGLFPPFIWQDR